MGARWKAPIYDHGKFGPLGAGVMVSYDSVQRPQQALPGWSVHVKCTHCMFSGSADDMRKHLNTLDKCYVSRVLSFWHNRTGFVSVTGHTRFPRVMAEASIEVVRDVVGLAKKPQIFFGQRVGHTLTAKYTLHVEQWAHAILDSFDPSGNKAINFQRWLKANRNDWLLRAVLRRAKHNLEFRSAVTGLQRISSDPWVQYDAFKGWMTNATATATNV